LPARIYLQGNEISGFGRWQSYERRTD
jgi:hypothetical protein